ncbi:MAG: chemotaxis protein CheW [Leptospirales bacterium]|nr:chemotaxis protein CheW [Leptospirales bacterium]
MSMELSYGGLSGLFDDLQEQESGEQYRQFLTFDAAGGYYAVNILDTFEILKPTLLTRTPNVEDEMLGVVNLRGNIIPIVDLSRKFRGDFTELENVSRIVVVSFQGKYSGLLVDRVLEVVRVAESAIEAGEVRGFSNEYIQSVGRSGDRIFLILNLERLLQFGGAMQEREV